jgi:SepF-like predicted cell division protein (DUF552 family)
MSLRGESMPFNLFRKKKSEVKPLFTFPQGEPKQATLAQPQKTPETLNNQTPDPKENPLVNQSNTHDLVLQESESALPAQVSNGTEDEESAGTQETEKTQSTQEDDPENQESNQQQPPETEPTLHTQEDPQQSPATEALTVESPDDKAKVPAPVESSNKTYLKAMPLKDLTDVEKVKVEVNEGNIIILRVTPLAGKSIEDVKKAVNDLFEFAESNDGDIARLGEERVVICPKNIRIWREKTPAPVASNSEPLPTVA